MAFGVVPFRVVPVEVMTMEEDAAALIPVPTACSGNTVKRNEDAVVPLGKSPQVWGQGGGLDGWLRSGFGGDERLGRCGGGALALSRALVLCCVPKPSAIMSPTLLPPCAQLLPPRLHPFCHGDTIPSPITSLDLLEVASTLGALILSWGHPALG